MTLPEAKYGALSSSLRSRLKEQSRFPFRNVSFSNIKEYIFIIYKDYIENTDLLHVNLKLNRTTHNELKG